MSQPALSGIRACVFDAYGTLLDVHAPAQRLAPEIGPKADRLSATWRAKQLEYSWLRSLMRRHADFWQVTQEALDFALEETGIADDGIREKLLALYWRLEAYGDGAQVLSMLRDAGIATAILSNGSPEMLDAAADNAGLRPLLDAVLSVEAVGMFKPDAATYQLAVDRFGIERSEICFVSSNGWDAAGAAAFGFQVAWLNRFGRPRERLPAGPAVEMTTLDALPAAIGLA